MKYGLLLILVCILFLTSICGVYAGDNNTTSTYVVNKTVPVSDDTVYALEDGHFNTSFSDGSNGYCLEYGEEEAKVGDKFYKVNTDYAMNNINGESVSNYLKTYFIRYYNHAMSNPVVTQHMIWHFSDNFEGWRLNYTIIDDVKSNPLILPDEGYVKWNSTHYLFYSFSVLLSPFEHHQNFFNYRLWFDTIVPDNCVNSSVNESVIDVSNSTIFFNETILNTTINIYDKVFFNQSKNEVNVKEPVNHLNKHITGNNIKILTIIIMILIVTILILNDKRR